MHMLDEIMDQPRVLRDCGTLNIDKIRAITQEAIRNNIRNVVIAARGTSDHAAVYAKYCIEILTGKPVSLAAPSVITLYGSRMDYKNALVIGVTQSGMAEDVREVLKCANGQGALTVAITNSENSPIAKEAQYHLYCNAGPEKSVAATKTFMSELFILEVLAASWNGEDSLIRSLRNMPDALERQLEKADEVIRAAGRYKFAEKCIILARGLLYPVALEAALKIQETTYMGAKAYAISDFWHGPLAMIEKNTPVILYASSDAAKKDALDIARQLRKMDADILMVTDSTDLAEYANETVFVPSAEPLVEPFHHVAVAQLFAYGLATQKGLSPDEPRSLKKITVTK